MIAYRGQEARLSVYMISTVEGTDPRRMRLIDISAYTEFAATRRSTTCYGDHGLRNTDDMPSVQCWIVGARIPRTRRISSPESWPQLAHQPSGSSLWDSRAQALCPSGKLSPSSMRLHWYHWSPKQTLVREDGGTFSKECSCEKSGELFACT